MVHLLRQIHFCRLSNFILFQGNSVHHVASIFKQSITTSNITTTLLIYRVENTQMHAITVYFLKTVQIATVLVSPTMYMQVYL